MENCSLILYIDLDFIGGVIVDKNNNSHLLNSGDDFSYEAWKYWLYFYINDERVSYGYRNKSLAYKDNSYNSIFKTKQLNLLNTSGILASIQKQWNSLVGDTEIRTFLVFSEGVRQLKTNVIQDYFKSNGFPVISDTLTLSDLCCLKHQGFIGIRQVVVLENTNSHLNFVYLNSMDDKTLSSYFKTGINASKKVDILSNKGEDSRKNALLEEAISILRSKSPFLNASEDLDRERQSLEKEIDNWHNELIKNGTISKVVSLVIDPSQQYRLDISLDNVERRTNKQIQNIITPLKKFCDSNCKDGNFVLLLLGTALENKLLTNSALALVDYDPGKVKNISNNKIPDLLLTYPKITAFVETINKHSEFIKEGINYIGDKEYEKAELAFLKAKDFHSTVDIDNKINQLKALVTKERYEEKLSLGKTYVAKTEFKKAKIVFLEAKSICETNVINTEIEELNKLMAKKRHEEKLSLGKAFVAKGQYEKAKVEFLEAKRIKETAEVSIELKHLDSIIKKNDKEANSSLINIVLSVFKNILHKMFFGFKIKPLIEKLDSSSIKKPVVSTSIIIGILVVLGMAIEFNFGLSNAYAALNKFVVKQDYSYKLNERDWVRIKGGEATIGNKFGEDDEKPLMRVNVKDFIVLKREVTNSEFAQFLNASDCNTEGEINGNLIIDITKSDCQIEYRFGQFEVKKGFERFPVIHVSWNGARAYTYFVGGRLPSEVEWEFLAQRCSTGITDFGPYVGILKRNENRTSSVDSLKALNGIYGLYGNVAEWCDDWYKPYASTSAQISNKKVVRGGSYFTQLRKMNQHNRDAEPFRGSNSYTGFRVVRDVK